MPRLMVHDKARQDVDAIADYIARDDLPAALRFYDAAEGSCSLLASQPLAGPNVDPPLARFPELCFWPITYYRNYLVLYRPLADGVEVLRVVHGARLIPRAMVDE